MGELKQKNYTDFTVKELLDAGLYVEISVHHLSKGDATKISQKFEGAKQSTYDLDDNLLVVHAWKEKFSFKGFVSTD